MKEILLGIIFGLLILLCISLIIRKVKILKFRKEEKEFNNKLDIIEEVVNELKIDKNDI